MHASDVSNSVCVCLTDSSNLEIFLEMLNDREIIIVVSHDEASTKYDS